MAQVNRLPRGYLDLIGAQTGGKFPPEAADTLSPTIDMSPLYTAQTIAAVNETLAHTVVGSSEVTIVPEGETWLLWAGSVRTTYPANSFDQFELDFMQLPRGDIGQAGAFPLIGVSPVLGNLAVAGQRDAWAFAFPTPLPLGSGVNIRMGTIQRDTLGVSRTARIQYIISQLKG